MLPEVTAHLERFEIALDRVSVARAAIDQLGIHPDQIMLAQYLDKEGIILGDRPSVRAAFKLAWASAFPVDPLSNAGISAVATVLTQPSSAFAFSIAMPADSAPNPVRDLQEVLATRPTVQLQVVPSMQTPTLAAVRAEVARIFWADTVSAIDRAPLVLETIVLGTRLHRAESPAMYGSPGSGQWVLMRIHQPGAGFFAFNLTEHICEFFPKEYDGSGADLGRALACAIA